MSQHIKTWQEQFALTYPNFPIDKIRAIDKITWMAKEIADLRAALEQPRRPDSDKVAALEKIARGETHVFDEDLGENVIVSMDGEEMQEVARSALAPASQSNCTCPSGDGSLRHPCPEHPPERAEVPVLDEEAEFRRAFPPISLELSAPIYDEREKERGLKYIGWMKRAALAAPAADSAATEQATQTTSKNNDLPAEYGAQQATDAGRKQVGAGDGNTYVLGPMKAVSQPAKRSDSAAEPSEEDIDRMVLAVKHDGLASTDFEYIKRVFKTGMRAAAPASADVGELPVTPKHIEDIKDLLLWPVTEDDAQQAREMLQAIHFDLSMLDGQTPAVAGYRIEQRPGDYSFMDAKHWPYNGKHYAGACVHELHLGAMVQNPGVDANVAAVFPSLWSGFAPPTTGIQASSAALPKDENAERYLFLRATENNGYSLRGYSGIGKFQVSQKVDDGEGVYWFGEQLDKAIDAARTARAALSASAEKGEQA